VLRPGQNSSKRGYYQMTTPRTFFRDKHGIPYRESDIQEAIRALERAKIRLRPDGAWIQGEWAIDSDGNALLPWQDGAVAYSAPAALRADIAPNAYLTDPLWIAGAAIIETLMAQGYTSSLEEFNDAPNRTKAEVMALFNEAQKLLTTVESREYPREPSVHDKIIALIHQAQEAAWQCYVTQTTVDEKTYRHIKSTLNQAITLLGEMKP